MPIISNVPLSLTPSEISTPFTGIEPASASSLSISIKKSRYPQLDQFLSRFLSSRYPQNTQLVVQEALKNLRSDNILKAEESIRAIFSQLNRSFVEQIMWGELINGLQGLEGEPFFNRLEAYAAQEVYLEEWFQRLESFHSTLMQIGKLKVLPITIFRDTSANCDEYIQETISVLTAATKTIEPLAPTRLSRLVGNASQTWNRLDAIYADTFRQPLHQYCGCHALSGRRLKRLPSLSRELIPLNMPLQPLRMDRLPLVGETVAIFGCDWGAGHKMPAQGIAELCRDQLGAHIYTFNIPDHVLPLSEDGIHNSSFMKALGFTSVTDFFNKGMKEDAFAVINFVRNQGGQLKPEDYARRALYIMRKLIETKATFVVSTISTFNEELIIACRYFDLPLLYIATDVKSYTETRDAPPEMEHFKMAIPVDLQNATVWGKVKEDQLLMTGPFVRSPFMKSRTADDLPGLREKWGILEGKKVIIFADSGNGATLPFIEQIETRFRSQDNPYQCFVLCRGQEALVEKFNDLRLPFVCAMSSANAQEMEELMTLAAYGGALVGKAGGSTVFESLRRGTRLLVPNIPASIWGSGFTHVALGALNQLAMWNGVPNQFKWEALNYEYMRDHRHQAREFTAPEQFLRQLEALTAGQDTPVPHNDIRHFEDHVLGLIPQMIERARKSRSERPQVEELA